MIIPIISISAILIFIFALHLSGAIRIGSDVFAILNNALDIMHNKDYDDEFRETKTREASLALLKAFFSILIRCAFALLISFTPIFIASLFDRAYFQGALSFMSRWDVILFSTLIIVAAYIIIKKTKNRYLIKQGTFYSLPDRILHRIAFCSKTFQRNNSEMENSLYKKKLSTIDIYKPIFITSLPRAGTTLLLELLNKLPSTATHIYRDMPFILSPILWARFSRSFHKNSDKHERAHHDGIYIGYDSPEAFEEIIWKFFWPNKYADNKIELWNRSDIFEEASTFFKDHLKKIIFLRSAKDGLSSRYVSKNNGNISRINVLKDMFPDPQILIPFRDPISQSASMLKQHKNFLKMHEDNPFIHRYMADIGHFEFGVLHRPFAFSGWADKLSKWNPDSINYWIQYWVLAFEHILHCKAQVILVCYESFCNKDTSALPSLCHMLEIEIIDKDKVDQICSLIRPPTEYKLDVSDIDSELAIISRNLYFALKSQAFI